MSYLDLNHHLTPQDIAIKQAAHEFSKEVIRPIAKQLDKMTPEQVIDHGSPFWDYMRQAYELGYHKIGFHEKYGGLQFTPLQTSLQVEEFSWASAGLAVAIGLTNMIAEKPVIMGNERLIKDVTIPFCECNDGKMIGCWGLTEPDHGSDALMAGCPSFKDPNIVANCHATLDGNEWVINGQKSSWLCLGPVATHCLLFCQIDTSKGFAGSGVFVVPMDLPGISRGPALDKMGQREMPQGEIFFDEVRIPKDYQLVGPERYEAFLQSTLCGTCSIMGVLGTGLARAAYEESLSYAKTRIQGGKSLAEYSHVKISLFNMLRRVETSRLLSRQVFSYHLQNPEIDTLEYSILAKVQGTEAAFKNANDAIQIFGGCGLSKESLIEKLFRDSRATLIQDGSNQTLAIVAGQKIVDTYPKRG